MVVLGGNYPAGRVWVDMKYSQTARHVPSVCSVYVWLLLGCCRDCGCKVQAGRDTGISRDAGSCCSVKQADRQDTASHRQLAAHCCSAVPLQGVGRQPGRQSHSCSHPVEVGRQTDRQVAQPDTQFLGTKKEGGHCRPPFYYLFNTTATATTAMSMIAIVAVAITSP